MKKRLILLLLVFVLGVTINSTYSLSRGLSLVDKNITVARVLEVIDGEAIKVINYSDSNESEAYLVKMIGIDTLASMDAMEYAYTNLIGKIVFLMPDPNESSFPKEDNWIYRYVYRSTVKSFNEEILEQGLAEIDEAFIEAEQYFDMQKCYLTAKKNRLGMWDSMDDRSINDKVININTAPFQLIMDTLEDTPSNLVHFITNYRIHNPYNSIEEVKFACMDFDVEWFEKNRNRMSVITDINSANRIELTSLFPYSYNCNELAEDIVKHRLFNPIETIEDIKKLKDVSTYITLFEKYISYDREYIYVEKEPVVANINTATAEQLQEATNLATYKIKDIIEYRDNNDYLIKTIGELEKDNGFYEYESNSFRGNVSIYTNINTASRFELETLFGIFDISETSMNYKIDHILDRRPFESKEDLYYVMGTYYDDVYPYFTITDESPEYININTGKKEDVVSLLGLDSASAKIYKATDFPYESSLELNFDYDKYGDRISLYTNINTASIYELEHIHKDIPKALVSDIIEFREKVPFTREHEIAELFSKYVLSELYNEIKDYFVFY